MKTLVSAIALAASLSLAGSAFAQASGGPDAKGNAPLKPAHTVNDGSAKRGANSFTQHQAMQHIEKSGFTSVSGLVKGSDGVWRGQAMQNGQTVPVAMDFKGNVSTPAVAAADAGAPTTEAGPANSSSTSTTTTTKPMASSAMTHHHRRWRHRRHSRCAHPSPNGAACSGVDRNQNGISDKEDRAMKAGAHP